MKKRVIGLGGIFFKTHDKEATKAWYHKHLGFQTDSYGANFSWYKENGGKGFTVWSLFKPDTNYFDPGKQEFMINYRVADLLGLLTILKEEGVQVIGDIENTEYGKFGWILDLEGRKIELWEPIDPEFEKILESENKSE
jgi:predicted enzyme related to lactoylglutathione lyase